MKKNSEMSIGILENFDEKALVFYNDEIGKTSTHEHSFDHPEEDFKFQFLVRDMFLDHFFP